MTSTPTTAYAKLAHVPVGAAFRITSGAYTDHVCLYRRVLMDFAVWKFSFRRKRDWKLSLAMILHRITIHPPPWNQQF
eukprot:scaffold354488_cov46-Attheya_sp.AAC.1